MYNDVVDSEKSILIWKILNLIDSGRRLGVDGLAEELEVSRRTTLRYIRTIEAAGFPLYYDRAGKYYRFPDGYSLKQIELTGDELNTLFVSSQYFGLLGNSFRQAFEDTKKKISHAAGDRTRSKLRSPIIPFLIKAEPVKDSPQIKEFFDRIVECYAWRVVAELDYETMWSGKRRVREVGPYGLVHYDGRLFLVGHCHYRKEIRIFSFEGIHSVRKGTRKYKIPDSFDLEKHLENALGVDYGNGDTYKFKIRFTPEAVKMIRHRKWHESQKVSYEPDGSAILSFRLGGREEILKWVMSWTNSAEILEPEWLRQEFISRLDLMRKTYA